MLSFNNSSLAANIVTFIVLIGVPIGALLTIIGVNIPVFIYVIWGFAFFILFVSVLLEYMPGRPKE